MIYFLQISAYCLTILVQYELAAVADLVDYTELITEYTHFVTILLSFARIEHDPIEENYRINCIKRTVLPLVDLRQILSVIRETRPCEISVP